VHKPSSLLIYGGIGLTTFGVAYDSGFFGTPDGHDHSVMFAATTATGSVSSVSISGGTLVTVSNVTGDEIVAPLPNRKPSQHQT
jgi:hypothetical protein